MRFENLLDDYGTEYYSEGGHHHARAGWIQMDCPRCSPGSQSYRLGYNIAGVYFNCWVCGRLPVPEAVSGVLGVKWASVRDSFREIKSNEGEAWSRATGKLVLPEFRSELLPAHRHYLEERGFDPDHLQETWHLQGIGISDQLSWRIFIPIRFRGKTVSWTTRSIDPHASLRYIAAGEGEERIPRGSLLYGEDYCTSSVIVHEGPSDVWATGPGAVATLGLSYTQEQVIRISRFPRRIVCFDNEPDAQERADKLCRNLRFYSGTTINFRFDEEGTDAGSAGDREINQLRKLLDG